MDICRAKVTNHSGGTKYQCLRIPEYKITITFYNKDIKQTKVKVLCSHHAKRLRNKLNYEINNLHKNKSYIQETLTK